MRPLLVNTFLTLDGVMQAPGGPEEDRSGGFPFGGWSANYWDEAMGRTMDEALGRPFDLLLGRKTYEIFASYWPRSDEQPVATILNDARKYVASRTLSSVEWKNSTLLEGDVAEQVARLKERPGPEIQVHGSGDLIQTLRRHGLVDRYRLWTFPVVVGRGKRLFPADAPSGALRLVESSTSTTGVVIATYEPTGEVEPGSLATLEPDHAEMERRRRMARE